MANEWWPEYGVFIGKCAECARRCRECGCFLCEDSKPNSENCELGPHKVPILCGDCTKGQVKVEAMWTNQE